MLNWQKLNKNLKSEDKIKYKYTNMSIYQIMIKFKQSLSIFYRQFKILT